jgi:hypothetical protein
MNSPSPCSHEKRQKGFLDWKIWVTYGLLATIGIPWYWPANHEEILFGMPLWAVCSLATSVIASMFTTWLLMTRWPIDTVQEQRPHE